MKDFSDYLILEKTASTNFPGSRIKIWRNRQVELEIDLPSGVSGKVQKISFIAPDDLVKNAFEALAKVWPLTPSITNKFKSISFGCSSYLTYGGVKSPDLDGRSDVAVKSLLSALCIIQNLRR